MLKIGQQNRLTVAKIVDFGVFLEGGAEFGSILLPKRYLTRDVNLGDQLDVFIYFDSEDKLIATTEKPFAQAWQFAKLDCVATTPIGAFLNWNLSKDLLVPFSEQRVRMQQGKSYLVFIYLDKASGRIVGTTKYNKWLDKTPVPYKKGEQVPLTVLEKTELGFKCAIDHSHSGLLFASEMYGKLTIGKNITGFIKQIRDDGKIDLSLQKLGTAKVDALSNKILQVLQKRDGFLACNDKSSPEEIFTLFQTSKATFKKTIGTLYKERKIRIADEGIYLNTAIK
ncbi:MAG: CvfB family protein [Vibrionaceae bacterium]